MTQFDTLPVSAAGGVRLILCAMVIAIAFQMARKARWREDRLIAAFLALLAVHQGLSTLQDLGFLDASWLPAAQIAGAFVAALCLLALYLLRGPLWELHNMRMRLRVSEMNLGEPSWSREELEAIAFLTRREQTAGKGKRAAASAQTQAGPEQAHTNPAPHGQLA